MNLVHLVARKMEAASPLGTAAPIFVAMDSAGRVLRKMQHAIPMRTVASVTMRMEAIVK